MIFDDKLFIAKKIKLARKQANFTQEELAEKINISAKQLSRIEIGAYIPSLPTFLRIIDILNINLEEFGIKQKENENSLREKFLKLIYSLNDKELEFCYKTLDSILINLKEYKN